MSSNQPSAEMAKKLSESIRQITATVGFDQLDKYAYETQQASGLGLVDRMAQLLRDKDERIPDMIKDLGGEKACSQVLAAVVVAAIETIYSKAA